MNILNIILIYSLVAYLVSAIWFLFLERREGFLLWRILSWVLSPLALPFLATTYLVVSVMDKWLVKTNSD